jgi:hypothetical protein
MAFIRQPDHKPKKNKCIHCGCRTSGDKACYLCRDLDEADAFFKDLKPGPERFCRKCKKKLGPERYFHCRTCLPPGEQYEPHEILG